jgi:thiol-disulfide isomerase/thioredoxin
MNKYLLAIFIAAAAIKGSYSQKAPLVAIAHVQNLINTKTEKVQVINFWATWCAPCVKEMPIFEKANLENKDIKVTLISLDLDLDPSPEKVYRFVERKKLTATVLLLNERDPNTWIDKIDGRWSGALPATLVVNTNTGKRKFVERELREGELEQLISQVK